MTIVYFIIYMPHPLIWTFRNSVGLILLDSSTVSAYCLLSIRCFINLEGPIEVFYTRTLAQQYYS